MGLPVEEDRTLIKAFFFMWGSPQRGLTAETCLLPAVPATGRHTDKHEVLLRLGLSTDSRLLSSSVYSSLMFRLERRDSMGSIITNSTYSYGMISQQDVSNDAIMVQNCSITTRIPHIALLYPYPLPSHLHPILNFWHLSVLYSVISRLLCKLMNI